MSCAPPIGGLGETYIDQGGTSDVVAMGLGPESVCNSLTVVSSFRTMDARG